MKPALVQIQWPNGQNTFAAIGADWLRIAMEAGIVIPTGCLGGSCGACEIEVNGKIVRACIERVPSEKSGKLKVDFASDPFW